MLNGTGLSQEVGAALSYTNIVPKTFGRVWARRANLIGQSGRFCFLIALRARKACQKPGLGSISR
jgi:hypothetical protein